MFSLAQLLISVAVVLVILWVAYELGKSHRKKEKEAENKKEAEVGAEVALS